MNEQTGAVANLPVGGSKSVGGLRCLAPPAGLLALFAKTAEGLHPSAASQTGAH